MTSKTLLLILDGYGLAPAGPANAASLAQTPVLDRLMADPVKSCLRASGESVGLPAGFIGNSEVGHLNIGAGRVVLQDMKSIDAAIESGEFFRNPVLLNLCTQIRARGGRLHLLGLLSDGGVHSHINHIKALIRLAHQENIPVLLHAFMDGRDTSPTGGAEYLREILPVLEENGGKLASVCGRFYAMDRDKRWERMQVAWDMLTRGKAGRTEDAAAFMEQNYAEGKTDEFILPSFLLPAEEAVLHPGDGVFFFNFRADRARQMAHALTDEKFSFFDRGAKPDLAGVASMTSYAADLSIPVAFGKDVLHQTLGETVSRAGLRQLRIAETEKYAHVTYFFSGGSETPFAGEDRILVPSPKDVPTYDLKPEMSAPEVTRRLVEAWNSGQYDFVVCNLANPDMIGHTGNLEAAVRACEVVDCCVGQIEKAVLASGGTLCVTADHGNVEEMIDSHGKPQTAHSMNPTPLVLENAQGFIALKNEGKLGDIAPTLLTLWGMPVPSAMTGSVLLAE